MNMNDFTLEQKTELFKFVDISTVALASSLMSCSKNIPSFFDRKYEATLLMSVMSRFVAAYLMMKVEGDINQIIKDFSMLVESVVEVNKTNIDDMFSQQEDTE